MSKEMATIALGVLVVITPFLGIPGSWKTFIFIIAGVLLAGIGFLLRGEALRRGEGSHTHGHFVENSMPAHHSQPTRDHGIGSLN